MTWPRLQRQTRARRHLDLNLAGTRRGPRFEIRDAIVNCQRRSWLDHCSSRLPDSGNKLRKQERIPPSLSLSFSFSVAAQRCQVDIVPVISFFLLPRQLIDLVSVARDPVFPTTWQMDDARRATMGDPSGLSPPGMPCRVCRVLSFLSPSRSTVLKWRCRGRWTSCRLCDAGRPAGGSAWWHSRLVDWDPWSLS